MAFKKINFAIATLFAVMFVGCSLGGSTEETSSLGGYTEEQNVQASLENITIEGRAMRLAYNSENADPNALISDVGQGSIIRMMELDSITLDTTGVFFYSRCLDSTGIFRFDSVSLKSPYVMLELAPYVENGYWLWDGKWSFEDYDPDMERYSVIYRAIVDLQESKNVGINVMTLLEASRVQYLAKQGMRFTAAKQQADMEILAMFGIHDGQFDFDKSDYAENPQDLMIVRLLSSFMYDWTYDRSSLPLIDALATNGSFAAVDSIKDFFTTDFVVNLNGYVKDDEKRFLGDFVANLNGLGQCNAEREGYSTELPLSDVQVIDVSCQSETWVYSTKYLTSDAVEAEFGKMTDARDGKIYKTVTYKMADGPQTWIAEDLKYNSTDGFYSLPEFMALPDSIAMVTYEQCVENEGYAECDRRMSLGTLINYDRLIAVVDSVESAVGMYQGICPDGWHLPGSKEWSDVVDYIKNALGSDADCGDFMARAGFGETIPEEGSVYAVKMDTTESVHSEGIWAVMAYFQMNGKVIISARAQYDEFGLNPYRVRCVKN